MGIAPRSSGAPTRPRSQSDHHRLLVRDGITRAMGASGLAGVALIHTLDAPGHFSGGPDTYLGVLYLGLIISCLAVAGGLVLVGDRRLWAASAILMALTMAGFILSRTVGLPGDRDDIGDWGEALGVASLCVESVLLALSVAILAVRRPAPAAEPLAAGEPRIRLDGRRPRATHTPLH